MPKIPLSSGVIWRSTVSSREDAEHMRQILAEAERPSNEILDPLTLEELSIIYRSIDNTYGTDLSPEVDFNEIKFALERVAGEYYNRANVDDVKIQISRITSLASAIETVVEFASMPDVGIVDTRDLLTIRLLQEGFRTLGLEPTADEVKDHLRSAARHLEVVLSAAGSAVVHLSEMKRTGGRHALTCLVPFCETCLEVMRRSGVTLKFSNDPDLERPGPLLEMVAKLENYLPAELRAEPGTWAKRFRQARATLAQPKARPSSSK